MRELNPMEAELLESIVNGKGQFKPNDKDILNELKRMDFIKKYSERMSGPIVIKESYINENTILNYAIERDNERKSKNWQVYDRIVNTLNLTLNLLKP